VNIREQKFIEEKELLKEEKHRRKRNKVSTYIIKK